MAEANTTPSPFGSDESFLEAQHAEFGKNRRRIRCGICNSSILSKGVSKYARMRIALPTALQRGQNADGDTNSDDIEHFWQVTDMFAFDNVGFTKTVGNIKYLSCADCEFGPIGFHDITSNPKTYNVAHARIKYE
eukprot:TRINITY_DN6551_c0_g1_i4.p1 TRINITY_DN6551_c0_g1~~TRINITY_DN6551_c0_g1_i4.p1  ORF type:complete len:135 (+),score=14.20 TRINITY_DN6551_c0_g1_i4:2-406(+)